MAAFTGGTELAAKDNPDGFWGQMSFSSGLAGAVGGLDPRTGERLGALDRTLAGVGAAGHVVGLAGAGVNVLAQGAVQGTRAFRIANGFAAADRVFAGGEAALNLASGNVVGAALSGLGATGGGTAAARFPNERGAVTMDFFTAGLFGGAERSGARSVAGIVTGGENLSTVTGRWMRGSHGNAGVMPRQVADALRGSSFRDFDEFREAFWRAVAADAILAKQFRPSNVARMSQGFAPRVPITQQLGRQRSYALHHRIPIHKGGGLFDLDNLMVVSPLYHRDVLPTAYHYR